MIYVVVGFQFFALGFTVGCVLYGRLADKWKARALRAEKKIFAMMKESGDIAVLEAFLETEKE